MHSPIDGHTDQALYTCIKSYQYAMSKMPPEMRSAYGGQTRFDVTRSYMITQQEFCCGGEDHAFRQVDRRRERQAYLLRSLVEHLALSAERIRAID